MKEEGGGLNTANDYQSYHCNINLLVNELKIVSERNGMTSSSIRVQTFISLKVQRVQEEENEQYLIGSLKLVLF
jgi:hypothetical protein